MRWHPGHLRPKTDPGFPNKMPFLVPQNSMDLIAGLDWTQQEAGHTQTEGWSTVEEARHLRTCMRPGWGEVGGDHSALRCRGGDHRSCLGHSSACCKSLSLLPEPQAAQSRELGVWASPRGRSLWLVTTPRTLGGLDSGNASSEEGPCLGPEAVLPS